jgi:hypothetical protein
VIVASLNRNGAPAITRRTVPVVRR